jgi:hypothetical protein
MRLFTTWITSLDRVDHAVTDEECAVRGQENRSVFLALCGAGFLPGPMEDEPGLPCPRCTALLQARSAPRDRPDHPRARRQSWVATLFRRRIERRAAAHSDKSIDVPAHGGCDADI